MKKRVKVTKEKKEFKGKTNKLRISQITVEKNKKNY